MSSREREGLVERGVAAQNKGMVTAMQSNERRGAMRILAVLIPDRSSFGCSGFFLLSFLLLFSPFLFGWKKRAVRVPCTDGPATGMQLFLQPGNHCRPERLGTKATSELLSPIQSKLGPLSAWAIPICATQNRTFRRFLSASNLRFASAIELVA